MPFRTLPPRLISARLSFLFSGALLLAGAAACSRKPASSESAPAPAAAAAAKVNYATEVHPILARSCNQCHAGAQVKGGLSLESREKLLAGGESGPAVILGKSAESSLVKMVKGTAEDGRVMPMKGARLTPEEISILERWIDEGIAWDLAAPASAGPPRAPLAPRKPELPSDSKRAASANPIDRILAPYFKERGVKPGRPVSDAFYARRAWFDTIGLPPPSAELEAFIRDRAADKRAKLAQSLLSDRRAYAEHWISFWNDALRNDFTGTGYIDGGRKQITDWLYASLYANKPFDEFVRQLLNPTVSSEGFIRGIVWRGVTNASQVPPMQAAQNISQVFMGTNLKCASCHDSFINQWKLADSYGLAAVFSDEPLPVVRCDAPTGQMAEMHFIYPELGQIDPAKPRAERMAQLAKIVTSRENGRFARTIVNRLWGRFFGRAIVEPVDDMDQAPWNADLLDYLAWDFAENGYDVKRTIALILDSRAYQMPAVSLGENKEAEYVFRGPAIRRLSAEQFLDSVASVTGVWQKDPAARVKLDPESDPPADRLGEIAASLSKASWIWADAGAAASAAAETVYFRKTFELPHAGADLAEAAIYIAADNQFMLYVNGEKAGEGKEWNRPRIIQLKRRLAKGRNTIAIEAANTEAGPAGLIAFARLRRGAEEWDLASDATWLVSRQKLDGWEKPDFAAEGWTDAAAAGASDAAPWNIAAPMLEAAKADLAYANETPRAWLARYDTFFAALGRPNREQVVTSRPTVATTLQALELTNGDRVAATIVEGAANISARPAESPRALARSLFQGALARDPSRRESALAREVLGSPVQQEGVEDLLWAIVNSPDFQLIY